MQVVFGLALLVAASLAQECGDQFFEHGTCLKTKASFNILSMAPQKYQEWETKAQQCFTSAGCDALDLEADIFSQVPEPFGKLLKGMQDRLESLTPEQRQCMRKQMIEKVYEKMQECTGPLPEPPQGKEWPIPKITDDQKEKFKGVIKAHVNVAMGIKRCADEKGADPKTIMECLKNDEEMKEIQEKACEARKTCAAENLNGPCQAQGEEMVTKVCCCAKKMKMEKKEKMKEMKEALANGQAPGKGKLMKLGQEAGRFTKKMNEMLEACSIDGESLLGDVKEQLTAFYKSQGCESPLLMCVARDLQQRRAELEPVEKLVHSYMEAFAEGGRMHAFCKCSDAECPAES